MECRYCQAFNEADEHRCTRCGRRLRASAARPAPESYISTATAPSLLGLYESVSQDAGASPMEAEPAVQRAAYQRALFQEMNRVVQMPAPTASEPARSTRSTPRAPRSRPAVAGQQHLDFNSAWDAPAAPVQPVDTAIEAMIYCHAPVALPTHRAMAAALDVSMVLMGLGLFLLTFHVAGGEIVLNRQTMPLFGGIAAVLGLFYHVLFCLCGGDTAGMRWTQLRLVNFDGQAPDREQRAYRLVGSLLSLLAAGLGLIWALVDEESLTWHDHISKTFPSPHQPEAS